MTSMGRYKNRGEQPRRHNGKFAEETSIGRWWRHRSQSARNSDKGKRATYNLRNTAENRERWRRDPRRHDLRGLDGPGTKSERSFWRRFLLGD